LNTNGHPPKYSTNIRHLKNKAVQLKCTCNPHAGYKKPDVRKKWRAVETTGGLCGPVRLADSRATAPEPQTTMSAECQCLCLFVVACRPAYWHLGGRLEDCAHNDLLLFISYTFDSKNVEELWQNCIIYDTKTNALFFGTNAFVYYLGGINKRLIIIRLVVKIVRLSFW